LCFDLLKLILILHPVVHFHEHANGPRGSNKGMKFFDPLTIS